MQDQGPFSNSGDGDKTMIRPNPGGRKPTIPSASAAELRAPLPPQPQPPPGSLGMAAETISAGEDVRYSSSGSSLMGLTGINPLTALAARLFSLISRVRNRAQHLDPAKLRNAVVSEIRHFETMALQAGMDPQNIKVARYALCATLDDVVLNTPWGGQSIWAQQSMVGTFHRETVGGDRFYDLLARLEQEPGKNIELLEFIFMCLSLGFEGRLRVEAGGGDRHREIRSGLARIIRQQRGQVERTLSTHWQGVHRMHKQLFMWKPVWISAGALATLLTGLFLGLSWLLSSRSGQIMAQLSELERSQAATFIRRAPVSGGPGTEKSEKFSPAAVGRDDSLLIDSAKNPALLQRQDLQALSEKISGFIPEEIKTGRVVVLNEGNTLLLRIGGFDFFRSGTDVARPELDTIIDRIAKALNEVKGPVLIVGHSDNVPINRPPRFPSNMHLSLARAETVRKRMLKTIADPARLSAEGRADLEPIASNNDDEGRSKNRRIEITLVRNDAP